MNELREGGELLSVALPTDEDGGSVFYKVSNNENETLFYSAKSITVTMESGQMGMVPWAKVIKHDGEVALVNLAQCEEVIFINAQAD